MPDFVLIPVTVMGVVVSLFCGMRWLCENDHSGRQGFQVFGPISLGCAIWLIIAANVSPAVRSTTEHEVQSIAGENGLLVQTIVVEGKPVNINEAAKASVPPGARVQVTTYSPWVCGVYMTETARTKYAVTGAGK